MGSETWTTDFLEIARWALMREHARMCIMFGAPHLSQYYRQRLDERSLPETSSVLSVVEALQTSYRFHGWNLLVEQSYPDSTARRCDIVMWERRPGATKNWIEAKTGYSAARLGEDVEKLRTITPPANRYLFWMKRTWRYDEDASGGGPKPETLQEAIHRHAMGEGISLAADEILALPWERLGNDYDWEFTTELALLKVAYSA